MSFSLCCLHLYSEIKIQGEKEIILNQQFIVFVK